MTNFIYNMKGELSNIVENLSSTDSWIVEKLVDHIEAQGKQLRELNAAITKKNATIAKYGREKEDLRQRNCLLVKKVDELNNGIHDADDLSWKQKYDALRHGSEQAIAALQKKCQEYKHSEDDATMSAIETLSEANKKLIECRDKRVSRFMERIDKLVSQCDELYMKNEELKEKYRNLEKNRDELLAEHDALYNENNELKEGIESLAKAACCPWGNNAEIISAKTVRIKELEEQLTNEVQATKGLNNIIDDKVKRIEKLEKENKKFERMILDQGGTIDVYVEEFKKLKAENNDLLESKNYIEKRCREAEKALETEKKITADFEETLDTRNKALEKEQHVNKDLNVIINNKNKLLDEYMTKYNNLEHNYKEEVRMKEEFKRTCFNHERTIESQNSTIKYLKRQVGDYIRSNAVIRGKLVSIGELANKMDDVIKSEE